MPTILLRASDMELSYKTAIALVCLIAICGNSTRTREDNQQPKNVQSRTIQKRDNGWEVAHFQTQTETSRYSELWGALPNDVAPVTTDLLIKNGEIKVSVGASAFLDLARVEQLRFEDRNGVRFLIIEGGGDGTGYRAELEIRKNEVVRRKVSSSTFPEDAYEETFYKYNNLDN